MPGITLVLITLVMICSPAYAGNPFSEGVQKIRLTNGQRESLRTYIEATRERLERVVDDVRGVPLSDAERLYKQALIDTVIDSYRLEGRPELLTRYVINQGLELAYGVPAADGNGLTSAGVLPRDDRYQGLRVLVLEDSVHLALAVLPEDTKVLEAGELIDLPFLPLAYTRLKVARSWSAAVFSETTQYLFVLKLLEHWLTSVASSDQLHQARLASHLLEVEQLLKKELPKKRLKNKKYVSSRLRELRRLMRRMIDQEVRNVEGLNYPEALTAFSARTVFGAKSDGSGALTVDFVDSDLDGEISDAERVHAIEQGSQSARYLKIQAEDEIRNADRMWLLKTSLAVSRDLNSQSGGQVDFELDKVRRDTKSPADYGKDAHVDFTARAYKKSDESKFSRTQIKTRVVYQGSRNWCEETAQSGSTCDESNARWVAFRGGGVVYKRNVGSVPDWTENSVSVLTLGVAWSASSENGYFISGDVGGFQPGYNLSNDNHKNGWQFRWIDAAIETGFRAKNGFKISNRLSTSFAHGNYRDSASSLTFFGEMENELKIRFSYVPITASWNAERQSALIEVPDVAAGERDLPENPWRTTVQNMFNLGVDF